MEEDYCLVCGGSTETSYAADLCDECDDAVFSQPYIFPVLLTEPEL